MELREGYKQTEVGVIPEDWIVKPVGEVFEFLRTGSNSRSELNDNGQVRYIHYGDIHTKWSFFLDFSSNDVPRIDEKKVKNLPSLQDGDLIMADASEDHAALGLTVEAKNVKNARAVAGLHTILLRADKQVLSDGFKGYIFGINSIHDALVKVSTGTSVYSVSKGALKGVPIFFPPTEKEQRAIAAALGDLDALIASLDALIAKKRDIKQGAMEELLTGKKRLAGFAEEWKEKALEEFATVVMGQSPIGSSYNQDGIGFPLINGPTEFTDKYPFKRQWTTSPTRFCEMGDALLCVRGSSTGRINIANDVYCIGRGVAAIRAKSTNDNSFLHFQLQRIVNDILSATAGSTFPNIDGKSLRNVVSKIPPSKKEQHAIAEILTDMDIEIAALEQKRAKYQLLKQGMMQELLTGKTRLL